LSFALTSNLAPRPTGGRWMRLLLPSRRMCFRRRGLPAEYESAAAATACFFTSTSPDCAATESRITDSPAMQREARRAYSSRIRDSTTNVRSWPKALLMVFGMRCPMRSCFPNAKNQTRYASLSGKPNAKKPGLVELTIAASPKGPRSWRRSTR
jgi:hypothetical protein